MILTKEHIKSINLFGKIDQQITKDTVQKMLIIVPTNRKLRSIKKDIINRSPNKTVTKIYIETLDTLSTKLLQQVLPFEPLSEAASSVFLKQSAENIKLNYFTNYKGSIPNGTLDRIKNVISEYKKHRITPEILLQESESLEISEKLKAKDIAAIYKSYLQLTQNINAFEIGDVYKQLNNLEVKAFRSAFIKLYNKTEFAVLLGFDQFTIPEIKIINTVAENLSSKLYIDFDYNKFNPLIFSHLEETYKNLESFGFQKIEDTSVYEFNDFIKVVREKLFLRGDNKIISKFQKDISVIKGRNTEEEIELIAKQIKNLIVEEKISPHNICVVFNLIAEFSAVVRDIFERFGIPFNLTDRTSLDKSSPVISIINLLEIAENDFYYKNIFRAFSGRFFEHFEINTVNLNYVAAKLKIVSGHRNWINTIENELDTQLDDDEKISSSRLQLALNDLKKIENILKPFNQKLTPSDFFNELLKLITESQITISVLHGVPEHREEDIAALTTFIETINEILQLIAKQNDNSEKYSLSFYLDQIKTASSWARFNVKGRSDYGVLITSVDEIRGLTFDYLFIAGLNDGIFPTRYTPEIFFSGSFAKKELTHQTEERYHFYQTLSTWRKHLYLSFSVMGNERELIESVFLKDFLKLFASNEIINSHFSSTAFSEEEIQLNYGIRLGNNELIHEDISINQIDINLLKRKIEIQKLHVNSPHLPNAHNGFILFENEKEVSESLNEFGNREYSISQLETYAKCPFKYFMQYVIKLTDIGEPNEEVEPIEIGSILHKILFEFYSRLRDENLTLQKCSDIEFTLIQQIMFETAQRNLNSPLFASDISFYEREKILGIEGNQKDSILYQFLIREKEDTDNSIPSFFEVAFGNINSKIKDESLSSPEPIIGGKVKFKGKIDRIDVNKQESSFDVVDYKLSLSSKPTRADITEGISLQLPLYLFAAKKLFERKEINLSPAEVYLYSLKFGENALRKQKISVIDRKAENRHEAIEELIAETIKKIENYIERIIKGEFPLTSLQERKTKVCKNCDFIKICRVEETDL